MKKIKFPSLITANYLQQAEMESASIITINKFVLFYIDPAQWSG